MSIILNTPLPTLASAHNCIKLCFIMDDVGSGNISKHFTWFVCDAAGNRLHKLDKQKRPKVNQEFCIDISEFKCELETAIPSCVPYINVDPKFQKQIKVHYGEVEYNSDTCVSTVAAKTVTQEITILNVALNSWNLDKVFYLSGQTGMLLSSRPKIWKICRGGQDFVWYYGTGTITLSYYKGSTLIQTVTHSFTDANSAQYITLDPNCYGITEPCLSLITMTVNNGASVTTFKTKIENCCCENYYGILFLDPCGGRSLFPACTEQITINRTGTEVCKTVNCNDSTSYTGRNSMINVGSRKEISFKIQLEKYSDTLNYVESFFASAGHHLQVGKHPNAVLRKFVLSGGSYTIFTKQGIVEVSFSGYMSEDLNSQREDV